MSNAVLVYRDKPLTDSDFKKIMLQAEKYFSFKPRMVRKGRPMYDSDNVIYKWDHDLVQEGYDLMRTAEAPVALVDAMVRPARPDFIKQHIFVLSRMKRYHAGDAGLYIIIAEIIRHLEDCSEFALVKVCADFATSTDSPFFPDPAQIIKAVKNLDELLKREEKPKTKPADDGAWDRPSAKQRRRNGKILKLAMKPMARWTKWETKYFEATKVKK